MKREDKAKIISQIAEKATKASIAVVSDFKGLRVEELEELRNRLREAQVDYQVVKNTLARIAFEQTEHKVAKDHFKDCCAIAFGFDDPIVATKILVDYAKQNKKFSVKFASFEGKVLGPDEIVELSKLPGREELLAKMLGTMNAVPTNFVGLFANIVRNFLYALQAIKEKKEN